jgi:signal transduction histidine kinase
VAQVEAACKPPDVALHEVLAANRNEVLWRWQEQVRGTLAPESMPPLELIDHLPQFVDEIIAALREGAGLPGLGPSPEQTATAGGHGEQRLRLGFSLDSVVREYGALRDAIVTTARDSEGGISFGELQVIFDCTITGIARAVSEYSVQRDAELIRQANEHFAFVAHELRDPISSAAMAMQQLKRKGQLPEARAVSVLERGLQRTVELVEQTLESARVASGIDIRRKATRLQAVFDDVQMGSVADAESKDIDLRVKLEDDQSVDIDVRLVRSAVSNLLRNAIKYSHDGGAVDLRGRIANGRVIIEVEDSCGGLEPGKVEQAFAPFVRLDTRQSGFGLGLAIAKQAVDAHGGTIRVQNLPGKGCIFVLELPFGPPT